MRKLLNAVAVLVLGGIALTLWLPLFPVPVQESVTRLVDGARRIGGGESAGETPPPAAGGGQRLSAAELDELRVFALGLINRDRADHGLPPVAMGSNPAAQLHAEDMLTNEYRVAAPALRVPAIARRGAPRPPEAAIRYPGHPAEPKEQQR